MASVFRPELRKKDIILPVVINLIVTGLMIGAFLHFGHPVDAIDWLDFTVEAASSLTAWVLFSAICGMLPFSRTRQLLLPGLFAMQLGRLTDAFDEIIVFDIGNWSVAGDLMTLVGEVIVAYAVVRGVMIFNVHANTDALTGLFNRRFHERALKKAFASATIAEGGAGQRVHALIALDIDNFKQINDHYGHSFGDAILKHTASLLRSCSRSDDIISRVGGEEFELLITVDNILQARTVAERIRESLVANPPEGLDTFTASFGVAIRGLEDTPQSLRARADEAVYLSKHAGKNTVTFA